MKFLYFAVDYSGKEYVYNDAPVRNMLGRFWYLKNRGYELSLPTCMRLPNGWIKLLTGKNVTWSHEPVKVRKNSKAHRLTARRIGWPE